jgi:hypothetical protein
MEQLSHFDFPVNVCFSLLFCVGRPCWPDALIRLLKIFAAVLNTDVEFKV